MNSILLQAKDLLIKEKYTCVFTDGEHTVSSERRGVTPLLELIDSKRDYSGYFAADKVVGAGAAYLYVILGVSEIWAHTVSQAALKVLEHYSVTCFYDNRVPHIVNRTGDGVCPMENAVKDATSPEDALDKIKNTLNELNKA